MQPIFVFAFPIAVIAIYFFLVRLKRAKRKVLLKSLCLNSGKKFREVNQSEFEKLYFQANYFKSRATIGNLTAFRMSCDSDICVFDFEEGEGKYFAYYQGAVLFLNETKYETALVHSSLLYGGTKITSPQHPLCKMRILGSEAMISHLAYLIPHAEWHKYEIHITSKTFMLIRRLEFPRNVTSAISAYQLLIRNCVIH